MRLLGCLWLMQVLYPEYADIDVRQEARDFYRLFLRYEITDSQLDALLSTAGVA